MPKTAEAIKGALGVLKNLKLNLTPIAGWETSLTKYGEFETMLDKITQAYPKAKETNNNPNLTPGPAFKEFLENQKKALALQAAVKPLVEKLEEGRQDLYETIKKEKDKGKADVWRNRLQGVNTQFNFMLVSVRQEHEEFKALIFQPTPAPPVPLAPKPAPPKPSATQPPANQYAKTPNQYQKSPVTPPAPATKKK